MPPDLLGNIVRQLGVDVVLQRAEGDRDRPQDERAGRAERADRRAQRGDEEARIRQCDDEAVPPGHRLEKLSLLDLGIRHWPSLSNRAVPQQPSYQLVQGGGRFLPLRSDAVNGRTAIPGRTTWTRATRRGRSSGCTSLYERSSNRGETMSDKAWGDEPFWGLGYDWDPDWVLTERQKELREKLIELCEQEMRANAKRSDDELLFPRRNFELLAEHGFLALIVPEEYGGLGENHVAFRMTCETIARYGCASTAMCYVMHIGAVATIMLRPTPELIDKYIRPLNELQDRHALLLRPRDRLALLVPVLLGRRALERRLQGAQEGVVDDVGRLRRLLRRADDEPGLQRLRRPVGLRHRRRARQVPAVAVGRARPARQPVGPDRGRQRRDPRPTRSSGRSATARRPTTRRSTPGS